MRSHAAVVCACSVMLPGCSTHHSCNGGAPETMRSIGVSSKNRLMTSGGATFRSSSRTSRWPYLLRNADRSPWLSGLFRKNHTRSRNPPAFSGKSTPGKAGAATIGQSALLRIA